MDLERGLVSSWNSSSSSSSSSSPPFTSVSSPSQSSAVADRMVRIELEAAEALADLARVGTRESFGRDSISQWGSKGKRAKKRVKSQSPQADPVLDAAPTCLSPQDRIVADQPFGEPTYMNVGVNPSPRCAKDHPSFGGGRSRQYLTEAEKEERRLRRILANRESARQTIRRRQALSEELTRKATDLAWENQNLRMKKESAFKEYQSLETTNKLLKAQLSKIIKTEAEESPAELKPALLEMHGPPSSNCPLVIYNQHPFSKFCWPSILQTSNTVQSHNEPPHAIVIPSNIPVPINGKFDSCLQEQETFTNINGPRTPSYAVPCPGFFQLPNHSNLLHLQHSFSLKHVQNAASTNNQVRSSTSKGVAAFMKNGHSYFPVEVESEAASSAKVRVIDDLNDLPLGFPPDGGGQCGFTNSKEMIPNLVAGSSHKNESAPQPFYTSRITGISSKSCQLISAQSEKKQDSFRSQIKKLLDATAATKARRKRKELTKMKNLLGRQCRTNC